MVETTISVSRITTMKIRYLFRLRSRVENLFFVILELSEILVWVPASYIINIELFIAPLFSPA